jgi:hypothetical protein
MSPEQIAALPPPERPTARLIAARGLTAIKTGNAWRVTGPGVDISAASLRYIPADELRPYLPHRWR